MGMKPHALPPPLPLLRTLLLAALAMAGSGVMAAAPRVSHETSQTVQWVVATGDNGGAPFIVVDKRQARLQVHAPDGTLVGATPVLLGIARADRIAPGTEDRPLAQIRPSERITPAGRFVARSGRNHRGEDVIWVDYDAGISMHRLRAVDLSERRLERLSSSTPADNRISYGCINVPIAFYDSVLHGLAARSPVVYVLPETRPAAEWFGFDTSN